MGKKLYVGNLTYGITDSDLQQLFDRHDRPSEWLSDVAPRDHRRRQRFVIPPQRSSAEQLRDDAQCESQYHQLDAGHLGQNPGMIAAHHAHADDADTQRAVAAAHSFRATHNAPVHATIPLLIPTHQETARFLHGSARRKTTRPARTA